MDVSLAFLIVIFLIGFVGSFISGMVGIGGSIIKYPMLLYLPPLFGLAAFSAHEVSGISAVQVFFATIGGVWAYRKSGYLNKSLILYMGASILVGSFVGGYGSKLMSEGTINVVYGILAALAAIMMFVPKKGIDDIPLDQVTFNKGVAAALAFLIGVGSGIVGAAGVVFACAGHARCPENPDANDDRHVFGHYVHFLHWLYVRENRHRPSRLHPGAHHGRRELACLSARGESGAKN